MALELIAEDGNQRKHFCRLRQLLDTTTGLVQIASPYVTNHELLTGIKGQNVHLLTSISGMDIVSGATSLHSLRLLVEAGINCRCSNNRPKLHAKVYLIGVDNAVVTSANLTKNAFQNNIEAGVCLTGGDVLLFRTWFEALWSRASPITLATISTWEQETATLRNEFDKLRKQTRSLTSVPNEDVPSSSELTQLRNLANSSRRFFVCNTNRKNTPNGKDERLMRLGLFAAVWEDFKFPVHMKKVQPGDAIFMFAKGVGIVGIGVAAAKLEILQPGHPDRLCSDPNYDTEWRVKIREWLAWAEKDSKAYRWKTMPNASFVDVIAEKYRTMREEACSHFLQS